MSMRFGLLTTLCCFLAPAAFVAAEFPTARAKPQTEAADDAPKSIATRFGEAFSLWRAGDETAGLVAKSIADEMCAKLGRCEVPKIVAHYAALTKEQRQEGFELETRALSLLSVIFQAHAAGISKEEWDPQRPQVETELETVWSLTRRVADLGARGRASALRAEYHVAELESWRGRQLKPEARALISAQVDSDANDALKDFEAFDLVRAALNPRSSLARIENYRGRLGQAHAAYEALAKDALKVGDGEYTAAAFEGLLEIARARGDEIEGRRCLEAWAGSADAHKHWPLARAWSMSLMHADRMADVCEFLDEFDAPDAADHSFEAQEARRQLPFIRAEALVRLGLADQAREAALEMSVALGKVNRLEQHCLEARIELAAGHAQAAIDTIGDHAQLAGLNARRESAVRSLLGEAYLALGDARTAKEEFERALQLVEATRGHALLEPLVSADELLRFNFIGEWEGAGLETVALLARTELELGNPLAAALASEDWQSRSLRGDNEDSAALRARVGWPPAREPLTATHLKAWAGKFDLGLVTWVFGADSGAVVHVKCLPNGELDCAGEPIKLGREALREAVRRLRECAMAGRDSKELALEIRNMLLPDSIRAHIGRPGADKQRLLVLLHGPLEAMPMELLGLSELRFDEELCLIALPGLPALDPGQTPDAGAFERWQLLGSPVDGAQSDGIPKRLLPGADAELSGLKQLHPQALLAQGAEFVRPALELALQSKDHCLHIATHLEVKVGESRSRFPAAGLLLDDGDVFTAREIADSMPRLPLVVLSACETGGGRDADGEGLFGVARAFLESGTRNLVVTLWPVEDRAACEFALSFHRALKAGKSPSQATRLGRAALLASGHSSRDWAAFRFLGRD